MGALDGKVIVVTGGGSGIGRAVAQACARAGGAVLIVDPGVALDGSGGDPHRAEDLAHALRSEGHNAHACAESIVGTESAQRIIAEAVARFGKVDALCNLAGILQDKSFLKLEDAQWDRVLDVHLRGTFHICQAFAKQSIAQGGGGRIVNTVSVSGLLGNFGQANYAAAKAAVYGLSRTLSIELQRQQIEVNCVAPLAKTRMTEDLPMFATVSSMSPEHVAPAYVYLASELSRGKSGYVLAVAGARMYALKLSESAGRFKDDDDGVWNPEEIAQHWDSIIK